MTDPAEKRAFDWEKIETDYRAGVLTLREISSIHGASPPGILKRAKKHGWVRDLSKKIQAQAEALVNKREVNGEVNGNKAVSEREVIEANAERIAQVKGEHRADITRMRKLVLALLKESEDETAAPEDFARLGELMNAPDDRGMDKLNELYRKAISLPQRIKSLKELAEAMAKLVALEREAYGIADAAQKLEIAGAGGGPLQSETTLKGLTDAQLAVIAAGGSL